MNKNYKPWFTDKLTPFLIVVPFLLNCWISIRLQADDSSSIVNKTQNTEHDKLIGKLQTVFIKKVDLQNASIQEALQFLTDESMDPEHQGVNFILEANNITYVPQPITMKLTDVTATEVLKNIRQQSGFAYTVGDSAIFVWHDDGEGLTVRTFTDVESSFVHFKPDLAADETKQAFDARGQLTAKGVKFPAGTSALYLPAKKELIVTNDPDQIEIIDELLYAAKGAGLHITPGTKFIEIKNHNSSLSP